jgi:hypothetical protein
MLVRHRQLGWGLLKSGARFPIESPVANTPAENLVPFVILLDRMEFTHSSVLRFRKGL